MCVCGVFKGRRMRGDSFDWPVRAQFVRAIEPHAEA
jgi:hypothetical protein